MHSVKETEDGKVQHAMITFFAKRYEDLPVARKIGDVVRIHRASVKDYKGTKQINVNLQYNSSWCLFHSADVLLKEKEGAAKEHDLSSVSENELMDDENDQDGEARRQKLEEYHRTKRYTPYKFSGKSYSFDAQQESSIIDHLRQWQQEFFVKSAFIFKTLSTPLDKIREKEEERLKENVAPGEYDLLVKILKIFERDEYNYELRIKDLSGEMWFIAVPKIRYGKLKEGEIIRIRSIKVNNTSKRNIIETKPSTNILRFTATNAIVKQMKKEVEAETVADKMMLEDDKEIIMSPILMTEFHGREEAMRLPLYKLDDLFLNYDEIPLEERKRNVFRVRFYALRVDP